MAIGSGLGSQFGFVKESVYGTFLAPTKFARAKSYGIERVAGRQQGTGISAGQFGPLASMYVETTVAATASVALDVPNKGFGVLLNALMGGPAVTPIVVTGAAYSSTFPLGDTLGQSVTAQIGAPLRGGTVVAHSLSGGKIMSAEFSCAVDAILGASLNIDGKTFSSVQTLATAAYTATGVFHGAQMALKLGAFGSEAAVSGVKSVNVRVNRPHDVNDYTAGQAGAKSEPVLNGLTEITAAIEADWLAKATFQDLAHSTTSTSLVWEFVGPLIAGAAFETFRITLPGVTFEPSTQTVAGVSELTNTWNAVWRFDGTNLPTIVVISTDVAL